MEYKYIEKRRDNKINNAKEIGTSLLNEIEKAEPIKRVSEFFWIMVIGYIIIILIVLFIG